MNLASLCVTCPHRQSGLCGVLLGTSQEEVESDNQKPGWQRFFAARAGQQIAARNQASSDVFVICAGWAFRYFQLADGRRQILQFLLPGDLFSTITIFDETFHFSVKALTEVQVSGFARSKVHAMCATDAGVRWAIAKSCTAECQDATELATALGQFSAEERIAHLLLQLMPRIAARNVIREGRYPLPLRQQHIADAVGLTPVHVSRVFSAFRDRGVLALSDGVLQVFNPPELDRIGSLS
jgi:CRP/FNR family transcriptional regulator, anaerobic regulatory protein